ncbi:hypothetical protein C2G38_2196890 [Gigaspora rosea]|uniref:Uncharacterized protein n=1 Tax=Gigaspora rosea TaxID=44941 RepID=A0A397V1J4_9GLOM|nr:hypothetical protein C2G38_2196890 [Gigaspora rosea]
MEKNVSFSNQREEAHIALRRIKDNENYGDNFFIAARRYEYRQEKTCHRDFNDDVTGKMIFSEGSVRVTGQFSKGFTSSDINEYEFQIEDCNGTLIFDMTKKLRCKIHINAPGTSPFEEDFHELLFNDIVENCFVIKKGGKQIGKAKIKC